MRAQNEEHRRQHTIRRHDTCMCTICTSTRCHPATSYVQYSTPRSAGTVTPGRAAQRLSWHQSCSLLSSQHHCHMCAATAAGNAASQDPSSRSIWSHRNVVHTPASVLCHCGDGQQAWTRCAGGHTRRVNTQCQVCHQPVTTTAPLRMARHAH